MTSPDVRPQGTVALAAGVADALRRDILTGRLAPGATVKERDHAAELGVSRTPMREAIRILAQEGLLQLRPSRSPIVADPSRKEVMDDFTVLIALETLSGELACVKASDNDLDVIAAAHDTMAALYGTADRLDLFEADMAFHRAVVRAAANPSLAQTHESFLARLWRARFLAARQRRNRDRVIGQHADILAALRRRDPDRIRGAIDIHLKYLVDSIVDLFEERDTADAEPGNTHRVTSGGTP